MNTHRPDFPSLIMGVIFISAGVYVFAVDELTLYGQFPSVSNGHRVSGLTQLIMAFLLLSGGSWLIWAKGKW